MDGVLVDSEPIHIDAWNEVVAEFGLHFSHEWFFQWIGVSDKNFTRKIIEQYNIPSNVETLLQAKRRIFELKIAQNVPTHKGVKELLPSGRVLLDGTGGEHAEKEFEPIRRAS